MSPSGRPPRSPQQLPCLPESAPGVRRASRSSAARSTTSSPTADESCSTALRRDGSTSSSSAARRSTAPRTSIAWAWATTRAATLVSLARSARPTSTSSCRGSSSSSRSTRSGRWFNGSTSSALPVSAPQRSIGRAGRWRSSRVAASSASTATWRASGSRRLTPGRPSRTSARTPASTSTWPTAVAATPEPDAATLALLRGEIGRALAETYPAFAARVLGIAS